MGEEHVWQCKICGRDLTPMLPLLILQVIEYMGKHMPIKALLTYLSKCPHCHQMRGYDESQMAEEDTEEVSVDQFNELMSRGVPVMKQIVPVPGEEPEEEPEKTRRKIGFRSEEDE